MTATPNRGDNGENDPDKAKIDAEFEEMMKGINLDDSVLDSGEEPPTGYTVPGSLRTPTGPNAPGSAGSLTGPTPGHPGHADETFDVPDDLSGLNDTAPADDPTSPTPIAIVATPLASAKALAGVVRLALAAEDDRTPFPEGAVTANAESGAILTGNVSEEEAHTLARLASLGLQRQGVVMFWRRGDRMIACRYRYGRNEGETSPALVLGALAGEVEDLLLGLNTLEDIDETYDPSSISRLEAMKWIAGGRHK
ncbi:MULTISPECIES: hypothetical protein [Dermabacter]|uniref:Uncharacterized protein n=1 Tax=Dermabacter vaginalis TaxID=1630135 RepID=A0A1B0ZJP5_9MICO|nr:MULTISPECIES: hypothetical protein [Dermabacter]ANP28143.1 hypothetical protein DAD186_15930 [Dermabacter vaginalis]RUP85591.1 hypothetical protein D8M36_09080 [Dermabacter sp. HSID17554]